MKRSPLGLLAVVLPGTALARERLGAVRVSVVPGRRWIDEQAGKR